MNKLFLTALLFHSYSNAGYEPFTIKDGIVASYDAVAGAFSMAAYAKAMEAENFQHPAVLRYKVLAQDCQTSSKAWSQGGNFIVERILKIDLKDPKQVAALGFIGSVAAIAAVKIISCGIDYCINSCKNK